MDKKGEINFVAILLTVAIAVSLLTTFVAIDKVESIKRPYDSITGYGAESGSGQVNITISQNLSIFVAVTNMSFGQGHVTTGKSYAIINSSKLVQNTTMFASMNWTNSSGNCNPQSLEIRNDGNTHAAITLTSDKTAGDFIGGTLPEFEFNASSKELGSCDSGTAGWTSITGASQTVCSNLTATDTKDEIYVNARLTIPYDTVGDKEATFTFGATAAS